FCIRLSKERTSQKVDTEALEMLRIIWEDIVRKPKNRSPVDEIKKDDGLLLDTMFIAAGNTKFIVELIRQYPDLIWKVNDNNQTIFHIAVKHRHEGVYNLLYEIGSMKDLITPLRDENDNNMLHLVGKSAKRKRLQDVSGVAFQMQRELLWFKEVESMIPPSYRERKNKDGLTPHELFTKEHKDLVTKGEEWMKGTANQCMVVAALIATIVFAAAFTVPGGYNQTNGIPIFKSKAIFMVFVVADAISLFSSAASILMFLSILTSRYAERDFLQSLPKKLMLGLATLFLSITTMTIAFSVSFFVLYYNQLRWVPILISLFGMMPVFLFARLICPLLADVYRSTYGSTSMEQLPTIIEQSPEDGQQSLARSGPNLPYLDLLHKDIALRIVNDHKELASDGEVLRIMATKPDAFVENSSNILWKTINWVFAFVLSRRTLPKWIREELELLESMEDIVWRRFGYQRGDKEVLEDLVSKCGDGGACKVVGWLLDDMVVRSWRRVVISAKKEAPVNYLTNPSDERSTLRPADVLVFGRVERKHACVDLTGVSPLVGLSSRGFTFIDIHVHLQDAGVGGGVSPTGAKEREDTSEKLLFTRLGNDRKDERNDGNDRPKG
ncbi:ankyrin repeat-containing domain, PGG domain protein, partial [Tanacetum coccineum]